MMGLCGSYSPDGGHGGQADTAAREFVQGVPTGLYTLRDRFDD
jgi:hypothetical protein